MTPAHLQPRREPSQARGHQRVRTLLEATGQLLEEVGYDALTTKAIAERAQTSIGSFYQFFPNRDAAVAALVDSYREQVRAYVRAAVSTQFTDGRAGITPDWVGSVVEGIRSLFQSFPGFGRLFGANIGEGALRPHANALRAELLDSLQELMGEAFPEVDAEQRRRCLMMVVETARGIANRIPYVDETTQDILRTELQRMLALYMSANFEHHGTDVPPQPH
ncbi:MAG TPA: TetR/AcrR family transcriptional regulator [Pseudomonadales bacterium]|nr:TetR/AcrR family transcriptional regulator [Pseudomonadales bacterium]